MSGGPPSGVHGPPPGWTGPPPPWVTLGGGPPGGQAPALTTSSPQSSATWSPVPSSASSTTTPLPSFTPDSSNQSSLPSNDPQPQQEHKSSIVGPLVGGVVGALILLALLIGWRGVIWLRRRRKQRLEKKGPTSPTTREADMEAALPISQPHESVTPYLYNRPGEIVPASATTLTNSVAPKKGPGYGVDSLLIAHNGIDPDPDARSLARSASTWTADSKHASTITTHTTSITASSPGGISVSTAEHTPAIRVDPNIRISNNNPPLEAVIERPVVGEDIPPPYQRDVA